MATRRKGDTAMPSRTDRSTRSRLRALSWLLASGAALLGAWPKGVRADAALEEVVVTAERRSEKAQDIPLAITAVSAADLESRGVRQAGDITADVPNLLLNSPYGPEAQPTFTLRGVTTQDFSENQSSPVAMYVDEVYKSVGAVQALQTYDLDRVEVLPAYDGYITAGAGNYSAYSVQGAVGGPVIDNEIGWRAAVMYEKRDGWVRSVVPGVEPLNGVDALAGRLTLLAKPNDSLTAQLKLSASRSGGTPYGAHAINTDPSYARTNDPTASYFTGNIGWFDNGAKFAVHKDIRSDNATLKIDWQLSPQATLTSVTGYDYGWWYEKSDDGGLPIFVRLDDPNTYFSSVNAFSQEIRIASHDTGAFGWLGGLYYARESMHATVQFHFFDGYPSAFVPPPGSPAPTLYGFDEYNNFDQLKDSRAVFFNATYALAPTVTLRAGLRYTKDKVTISNFYALEGGLASPGATTAATGTDPNIDATTWWTQTIGASPATYAFFQTGVAPQSQGVVPEFGKDTNNVSGKIGLDWKPGEGLLAYASISQGYRGVAFNGQAYNNPGELTFADPEKLTSYELGLKTELWDRRAVFNVAAFHYDYKNQQFLDAFTLPGVGGTLFHTINAPRARIDGAEFEFRAKATADLEIFSSLGLMSSKYVELTLHQGQCVIGTPPSCTGGVPRICCVGNKLIQAPDVNASLGVAWRVLHVVAGDLRLFIDGNYYGKQYFDAFNTERDAQGGYGVANARIAFESTGKLGYAVGAWVKNLANREYLAYALNQKDADTGLLGFDYALVGEPRTYGIDVTVRF
ncbi:MAG: TonB-dependent receptor [Gammaproteobacteria bacterium]|nr:MAG: TonB-dependent receptor [Gammaproteobacteria bacterium]